MFPTGKRRIAICFSGQLRTWRKCVESWHNVLLHNGNSENIDVFCHLWNYNTIPNSVASNDSQKVPQLISQSEIDEVLSILKPKKFIIEPEKADFLISENQAIRYPAFLSQFYGILKAARLKKQYEIENDIMYNVVVRSRYDSFYFTRLSDYYNNNLLPNTMYGFHFGWDFMTNRGRMGDICWMADSQTYDLISDYYLNLNTIDDRWFSSMTSGFTPELVFFHYIKKNNISIINNSWDIKLFRESRERAFNKSKNSYEIW